ncbi:MAG: flagellar motor switch protein FliN [Nitrospirae bacterium]|nr:MAG: flagellar motor switch protein FliN [Nitrospirota bacterium]
MAEIAEKEKTQAEQPENGQPFDELQTGDGEVGKARDIEFLLDIPLEVTVELGRTRMLIQELLQLGQGSVVELDKLAGEPMEILVNNKLIARGEVVVVNEKFGVRLTDIISPMERIKQLR